MKQSLRALSILAISILGCTKNIYSQDSGKLADKLLHFPDKVLKTLDSKSKNISNRLTKKTGKYLHKLSRQERKLKMKLAAKDSVAAVKIFSDVEQQYAQWDVKIKNTSGKIHGMQNKYIPHLDTLQTALNFLAKADGLLKGKVQTRENLKEALSKMDVLQNKFNRAEEIKEFIQQRRQFLTEQLGKYGMVKDVKKLQKQVYYYQAQVEEYKRLFDDPSKLESKAIELLKETAVFKEFFSKHAQLAGMFRLPGNPSGTPTIYLAGLQTREGIQQELMKRFGSGQGVQQMMQQQVQGAQSQLNQLKDKINKLGGRTSDMEMPDFKPNNQKTRRFRDRLELGTNLQTVKSNRFFPSTSDIGLSLGYKLNDKSIVGVGSSYKMGWGKDIRHLSITHQGVGIRSFMDYKIKGSIWISGGAEMNYRSQFKNFEILNDYSAWQKSALLGLSKKYQVNKKLKGNIQLMYDFLWKEQVVKTQPVVFRVGYGLR